MPIQSRHDTVASFLSNRLMRVSAHADDSETSAAVLEYCALVDDAIDTWGYADSLFRVDSALLQATRSEIFQLRDNESNLLSCALHMSMDDNGGYYWINGVVKSRLANKFAVRELLARSIIEKSLRSGNKTVFRACYRLFPSGYVDSHGRPRLENKGSAALFSDFEFEVIDIESTMIQGTYQDRHLFPSAEQDGRFLTKIVQSTEYTLRFANAFVDLNLSSNGSS